MSRTIYKTQLAIMAKLWPLGCNVNDNMDYINVEEFLRKLKKIYVDMFERTFCFKSIVARRWSRVGEYVLAGERKIMEKKTDKKTAVHLVTRLI